MLAVNSVNNCPFCTSLHGELGRMAGVSADALPKVSRSVHVKHRATLRHATQRPRTTKPPRRSRHTGWRGWSPGPCDTLVQTPYDALADLVREC